MTIHGTVRWQAHLAVWLLAALAASALVAALAPVALPLLTGAALAMLVQPVLARPAERLAQRLAPWLAPVPRRTLVAGFATLTVAGALAGSALLLLWSALGGLGLTIDVLWGLATGDGDAQSLVVERVVGAACDLHRLYPDLPLDPERLRPALADLLGRTRVGGEFLRFLASGTGGALVEAVLAAATMFYVLAQGGRLGRLLLVLLPLDAHGRDTVRRRFRGAVRALVLGSGMRAAALGLVGGILAWAVAGFHPVLVGAVAALAGLLPIIGATFIWLPLTSLLASQGRWPEAACLAVGCQCSAWLLDHLAGRAVRALGGDRVWMGYLLFLAVAGGILAWGVRGLVLGPAAVVATMSAGDLLAAMYAPVRRRNAPQLPNSGNATSSAPHGQDAN